MAYNSKAKLKLLYLKQILEEETDAEHGLTMSEIIGRLADVGISAERKGIYRDIEILREFGVDIHTYQRNPVEYAIERRDFDFNELMLIVDAIESCKALTQKQATSLIRNIKLVASDHQRALLDRRIHVTDRIKSKSDGVFDEINLIHQAMHDGRKIEFRYFKYYADGKRRATQHEPYLVTPVAITYDGGFYYLTAWNDKAQEMFEFRIDRMGQLSISDEAASRNQEISRYSFKEDQYEYFGRFDGEPVTATLKIDEDKVEIILDRFGKKAYIYPSTSGHAYATVKVRKSPQFFGWIAGMDNTVRIEKPKKLKNEYRQYLKKLLDE